MKNLKSFLQEDISIFAPQDELKKAKYNEIKIFTDGWQSIELPKPPENLAEVRLVVQAVETASPTDISQYKNCDKDASYYVKKVMEANNLFYDNKVVEYIEEQCVPIIRHYKNYYNRPRPYQVAAYHNIDLKRFKTGTSKTPSYPSGHTVQPLMVAFHYAKKYPQVSAEMLKGAQICGYGRVIAGLHYPSDYKSGIMLATKLKEYLDYDKF